MRLLVMCGAILLVLCGCGDNSYRVAAEVDGNQGFFGVNTGRHMVMKGGDRIGVFSTYAEADSVCRVLNARVGSRNE